MNRREQIYQDLMKLYPDAHCQLNYGSDFQLAVAVLLSAQTTDVSVNRVTERLFAEYPDAESLSRAPISALEEIIHQLGLYHAKARNISLMASEVVRRYKGKLPDKMEELTGLPGIGVKCANVILAEIYKIPAFPVDTHVSRISRRLGIAGKQDSLPVVERKLKEYFPRERWIKMHHLLIFFGRNMCTARKPDCAGCPFSSFCTEISQKNVS
ncbi:MAG: endonuclease III [Erysipelotrichaceae bacterium]|nr:endonuclease III [Erysipelotrichaceae bacterium]